MANDKTSCEHTDNVDGCPGWSHDPMAVRGREIWTEESATRAGLTVRFSKPSGTVIDEEGQCVVCKRWFRLQGCGHVTWHVR